MLTRRSLFFSGLTSLCLGCGSAQDPKADAAAKLDVHGLVYAPLSDGTYAIHPKNSPHKCLDVQGANSANGTAVQIYDCNGSQAQQWRRAGNAFQILGNKCLDVKNGIVANGTALQIWDCVSDNVNQHWNVSGADIKWAPHNTFCLDLPMGVTNNGTLMQIWSCYPKNSNQMWAMGALGGTPATPAPNPTPAPAPAPTSGGVATSGTPQGLDVAPYFFTWANGSSSYAIKTPLDALQKAGMKSTTIAFALSGGGCNMSQDVSQMAGDIVSFVDAGGRAIISYGGADGTYLQEGCSDPAQVAALIQNTMALTHTTSIDFDVEGSHLDNTSADNVLIQALKIVQAKNPDAYISYTLPVAPNGLLDNALNFLKSTYAAGVKLSRVNIMTMDYGQGACASQSACAISSTDGTVNQLRGLYGNVSDASLYHQMGITALIGQEDDNTTFSLGDAQTVAQYAKAKGVGMLSFWAMQRDRAGNGGAGEYSNAQSNNFQYLKAFQSAQ